MKFIELQFSSVSAVLIQVIQRYVFIMSKVVTRRPKLVVDMRGGRGRGRGGKMVWGGGAGTQDTEERRSSSSLLDTLGPVELTTSQSTSIPDMINYDLSEKVC